MHYSHQCTVGSPRVLTPLTCRTRRHCWRSWERKAQALCPGCRSGCKLLRPRTSSSRDAMQDKYEWVMIGASARALHEVDGDWPWNEAFFPKPSAITNQDSQ